MTNELTPVPRGHVAAVVTFLEMKAPPRRGEAPLSDLRLQHWPAPDLDDYRALFRSVGRKWLWFSRLAMTDAQLRDEIAEVHAVVDRDGRAVGLVELDFRSIGEALIRFLGLVPELAGRGHGRWLLDATLDLAWRDGIRLVRVHTCSLDHPAALPAYLRAGFVTRERAFESFPDPRLRGLLPRDCAPQIPLLC